jgi:hypothetical protein
MVPTIERKLCDSNLPLFFNRKVQFDYINEVTHKQIARLHQLDGCMHTIQT